MTRNRQKPPLLVQIAGVAVIVVVLLILFFPHFLAPASGGDLSDATASKQTSSNSDVVDKALPAQTQPPSTAAGKQEQDILSWLAPLLNPGNDTTAFENMTPEIRKYKLSAAVKYQVSRLKLGLSSLDQLAAAADAIEERMTTLARTTGFIKSVNLGPARSLWESLSSRPAMARGRLDDDGRRFHNAIDRLQQVESEGFRELNDPRLDARKELDSLDPTLKWTEDQEQKLRESQRDLDRTEFVVWTRARELPAKVVRPTGPPAVRQAIRNLNSGEHLASVGAVREKLNATRKETMTFLHNLSKVNEQIQSFLKETDYVDDPVGSAWTTVQLTSTSFLATFHWHELGVDAAAETILTDARYTPSITLAPVRAANEWLGMTSTQSKERQLSIDSILKSIASAPFLEAGGFAYMVKRPDGRTSTNDAALVRHIASRRKIIAHHAYAITFYRPASRYNWAAQDILEPYLSYDYWWRWATDADWYRGSDLRLDPEKFPKDAAATQKLWQEFRHLVDADERLTPQCIKIALADRSSKLWDGGRKVSELNAADLWTYWETLFLPPQMAKNAGYRRPATPDATTARLLDAIPAVGEFPPKLNFPWSPGPFTMPRQWEPDKADNNR